MLSVYVTVYNETQAYGGSEEGGWWYTQGEPIDGVYTICCGSEIDYGDISEIRTNHAADCPARGAAENYHRQYVEGHKEEYLRSFTHRPDGVSWLDSDEDAPDEYRGELATNGNNHVRIADAPPQSYPQHTPYYE